jgi:hypothetical protein
MSETRREFEWGVARCMLRRDGPTEWDTMDHGGSVWTGVGGMRG